jgi:hypothetical protein
MERSVDDTKNKSHITPGKRRTVNLEIFSRKINLTYISQINKKHKIKKRYSISFGDEPRSTPVKKDKLQGI